MGFVDKKEGGGTAWFGGILMLLVQLMQLWEEKHNMFIFVFK